MTVNENKATNLLKKEEGYNVCPRCGREAYIFINDNEYVVGCLHCGLRRGIAYPVEEVYDDASAESARYAWNHYCIKSEYYEDALEALKASNGSYVLAKIADHSIVSVCDDFDEVKKWVSDMGDGCSLGIYLLVNGALQYLGCTYLVWLATHR